MLTRADILRPRTPAAVFGDSDRAAQYWIRNGVVHFRFEPIPGADADTFRCYLGGYAADKKGIYSGRTKLKAGDPTTFQPLSYTYFKDATKVWSMGIRIPSADAASFGACDDGIYADDMGMYYWYGYGKDKQAVYYFCFEAKANVVKKADPESFESLNDGVFGRDRNLVFVGTAAVPKVVIASWRHIAGVYSADVKNVYFKKDVMKGADPVTFDVLTTGPNALHVARDKMRFYLHDQVISQDIYDELVAGIKTWLTL